MFEQKRLRGSVMFLRGRNRAEKRRGRASSPELHEYYSNERRIVARTSSSSSSSILFPIRYSSKNDVARRQSCGLIGSTSSARKKTRKKKRARGKVGVVKSSIRGEKSTTRISIAASSLGYIYIYIYAYSRFRDVKRDGKKERGEGERQRGKRKRKGQRIPGAEEPKAGSRARRTNGDRTRWSD